MPSAETLLIQNSKTMSDSKLVTPISSSSTTLVMSSSSSSTSHLADSLVQGVEDELEEAFLTGLEGVGKTVSFEKLKHSTISERKPSAETIAPLGIPTTPTSSACSSIADLEKRSTTTFIWVENILESYYSGDIIEHTLQYNNNTAHDGLPKIDPQTQNRSLIMEVINAQDLDFDSTQAISSSFITVRNEDEKKIQLLDYNIIDFDQPTMLNDAPIPMLSKLLSLSTKFLIKNTNEIMYELFVVKIPPEAPEERELAKLVNGQKREIYFYELIVPFLEAVQREFTVQQNIVIKFGIPNCIYGTFNRQLDAKPLENVLENLPNAESILVLNDLRVYEFGKRSFIEGLSIDETKAALSEICKIHVTSWAFHQKDGYHVGELFHAVHKPIQIAHLYQTLLINGFQILKTHLQKKLTERKSHIDDILLKISSLELRIHSILLDLMELPAYPSPVGLIHMDLWTDNILFRKSDSPDTPSPPTPTNSGSSHEFIIDKNTWKPKPFIPSDDLPYLEEYNKSMMSSQSKNSHSHHSHASHHNKTTDNETPHYMEYVTDPIYATLDLTNKAFKNSSTEDQPSSSINTLSRKIKIPNSSLECRIIDWQMFSCGSTMHDVALLLTTSLSPEIRRKNTDMFIKYYLQVFEEYAKMFDLQIPFDFNCLRKQYRKSSLFALLLVIGSIEVVLADETTEYRFMELLKDLHEVNIL